MRRPATRGSKPSRPKPQQAIVVIDGMQFSGTVQWDLKTGKPYVLVYHRGQKIIVPINTEGS